jgi:hypothetical protein
MIGIITLESLFFFWPEKRECAGGEQKQKQRSV